MTEPTAPRRDGWDSAVDRAEALTGITLASIRPFPGPDYAAIAGRLPLLLSSRVGQLGGRGLRQHRWAARVRRALAGPGMTLLTGREVFAEISYADPATALAYPPDLALTTTAAGRLAASRRSRPQFLQVGQLRPEDGVDQRRPCRSLPC